mgnify:CR=1 FL=1
MPTLAACSWSLQPTSPEDLVAKLRATSLRAVQLALGPLVDAHANPHAAWNVARTRRGLADAGVRIVSGMMATIGEDYSSLASIRETGGIVPDRHWQANLARARLHVRLACELNLNLVTFHAGFVPHHPTDASRPVLIQRLRTLARLFACYGLMLGLETGQERVHTLIDILRELSEPNVRVNFDPANMILYGMGDPIDALRTLLDASHRLLAAPSLIAQVHIKDALAAESTQHWGTEIAVLRQRSRSSDGRASVDWPAFFAVLRERGLLGRIDLVIEREAGSSRVQDVDSAAIIVRELVPDHQPRPLKVGVLGMGFMGQTHARAAMRAGLANAGCSLEGVCDPRIEAIAQQLREAANTANSFPDSGNLGPTPGGITLDLSGVRLASKPQELLHDDTLDLIVVATPTDSHVAMAHAALEAGKHVLVEKPVAITSQAIEQLRAVANAHPQLSCIPAMVMRWWPGWAWTRGLLHEQAIGSHRALTLERMGQPPTWSEDFYNNALRSGGAIIDLHVHDVDFVCWTFGVPHAVTSQGDIQHVETEYQYGADAGVTVRATGSWRLPPGERFRMSMLAQCDSGGVQFKLGNDPALPWGTCAIQGDPPFSYDLALSPYERQLRDVVECIHRRAPARCSLDDAFLAARVLEAEQASLRTGTSARV